MALPAARAGTVPSLPPDQGGVEQQLFRLLLAAAPVVKARIRRRRLGQPVDDRTWSTSDAFSSVLRRVLVAERGGTCRALAGAGGTSLERFAGGALWAFIDSVARSVVGDFGRQASRDRRLRRVAVELASARARDEGDSGAGDGGRYLLDALATLDPIDQSIMLLRLRGIAWTGVARAHGMEPAACRKRWSRAVERLRDRIAGP
jgi:hypothetical protein